MYLPKKENTNFLFQYYRSIWECHSWVYHAAILRVLPYQVIYQNSINHNITAYSYYADGDSLGASGINFPFTYKRIKVML